MELVFGKDIPTSRPFSNSITPACTNRVPPYQIKFPASTFLSYVELDIVCANAILCMLSDNLAYSHGTPSKTSMKLGRLGSKLHMFSSLYLNNLAQIPWDFEHWKQPLFSGYLQKFKSVKIKCFLRFSISQKLSKI